MSEALHPDALTPELLAWADRVAAQVARKLPPCFDLEDLCQVARLTTWQRLQHWDQARNDSFTNYAYIWVRGACLMSVRRREWRERQQLTAGVPLDESTAPVAQDDTQARIFYQRMREHLDFAARDLDHQAFMVVQRYFLLGWDLGEIADDLGIRRTSISQILQRAYAKMREELAKRGITASSMEWR